jgi:hypothetical protein
MQHSARRITAAPSLTFLQDVFRERAEARALLYEACVYDLHEAVDVLQQAAEDNGLIAAFGQDLVQVVMASAFHGTVRSISIEVETLIDQRSHASGEDVDDDDEDDERLATSTVQAVEYLIQQNDPKRLCAWLAKHTQSERLAIKRHFERRK